MTERQAELNPWFDRIRTGLPALGSSAAPLTPVELVEIWKHYGEHRDRPSRDRLIEQYAPLVRYIAHRAVRNVPLHVDRRDFVSYGYLGLIRAVERFDMARGVQFQVFALSRIRGAILDGLRSDDELTRTDRHLAKVVRTLLADYEDANGGSTAPWATIGVEVAIMVRDGILPESVIPALRDVAGDTNARASVAARTAMALARAAEHREDVSNADQANTSRMLEYADAETSDTGLQVLDIAPVLAARFAAMPERNRAFLILHYYQGLNLKEVGEIVGVSDSRVGQVRLETIQNVTK